MRLGYVTSNLCAQCTFSYVVFHHAACRGVSFSLDVVG